MHCSRAKVQLAAVRHSQCSDNDTAESPVCKVPSAVTSQQCNLSCLQRLKGVLLPPTVSYARGQYLLEQTEPLTAGAVSRLQRYLHYSKVIKKDILNCDFDERLCAFLTALVMAPQEQAVQLSNCSTIRQDQCDRF